MARFLVRRLLYTALLLFIISFIVYLLFFVLDPGDKAANFAGKGATPQIIEFARRRLHLDRPWYVQYGSFLGHALQGNFGRDFANDASVTGEITQRLPVTASLAIGAALLWLVLGIFIGIVGAVRPRTVVDRLTTTFALTFYSIPSFVLGLIMLLIFFKFFRLNLGLAIFPPSGYVGLSNPLSWIHHLILPWLTLALISAAGYARLTRGSMLEVLGEDYIRTARSKGLSERRVVYRHGLRSALTPVLTVFGVDLGGLLGGAIITESIFGLPGIGALALQAVQTQNLPVIAGTVLVAAFFVIIANVLVDIGYALLDARVRLA